MRRYLVEVVNGQACKDYGIVKANNQMRAKELFLGQYKGQVLHIKAIKINNKDYKLITNHNKENK